MIALQPDHKLLASFKLYLENLINNKGRAFTNWSGYFYPIADTFSNYFTYALPFQPLIGDCSVGGANIMSGVYLDNTFISPGQSGLIDINFNKGQVYFNSQINNATTRLSGNYAVSDFAVKLTHQPEEELLFETKYRLKPKVQQTLTGLGPNEAAFPVIYVKNFAAGSKGWAFGGTDEVANTIRLIVFADSQFNLDGVTSLIRNQARRTLPLITGLNEMPYNDLGGYSNGHFYYHILFTGRHQGDNSAWIENIDVSSLPGTSYGEIRKLNPGVFVGIVDIVINRYFDPRLA